jgi:peptidoglycan glycosyltransferase
MAGRGGDVIVSDPRTGEVLAAWALEAGLRDAYPPGSTAKIVESAAALEEGMVSAQHQIPCQRVPPILGERYRCVHPPSRLGFTLPLALANSCNYYFTVLSLQLASESLSHWYSVFGFGRAAEVNGTAAGRVAIRADARRKALAALGEADVLATPAQVLEAYSVVASRGEFRGLWSSRAHHQERPPVRHIRLRSSTLATLIDGLVGCVQFGTCQEAAVPSVRVAGKTGTAAALDGSGATHAWFVSFAPAANPEIAVVVFLDRGTGAHSAAPVAGAILREYFAARNQFAGEVATREANSSSDPDGVFADAHSPR